MSARSVEPLVRELEAVFRTLIDQHESLHDAVRGKLDAMRRADNGEMLSAAHREGEIVARIREIDEQRKTLVVRCCQASGIPKSANAGHVSLKALAGHLNPNLRARLTGLGEVLRERMLEVAEANRVVELVSREMLDHFKQLFSAFTRDEDGSQTYSAGGVLKTDSGTSVLDAVG